jgi:hypothetical protein
MSWVLGVLVLTFIWNLRAAKKAGEHRGGRRREENDDDTTTTPLFFFHTFPQKSRHKQMQMPFIFGIQNRIFRSGAIAPPNPPSWGAVAPQTPQVIRPLRGRLGCASVSMSTTHLVVFLSIDSNIWFESESNFVKIIIESEYLNQESLRGRFNRWVWFGKN